MDMATAQHRESEVLPECEVRFEGNHDEHVAIKLYIGAVEKRLTDVINGNNATVNAMISTHQAHMQRLIAALDLHIRDAITSKISDNSTSIAKNSTMITVLWALVLCNVAAVAGLVWSIVK